jgi:hypothetical protein
MTGLGASPELAFETAAPSAFRKMLGAIGYFFRSLDRAMAFSWACEAELRAGRIIDEAVLNRIMAQMREPENNRRG